MRVARQAHYSIAFLHRFVIVLAGRTVNKLNSVTQSCEVYDTELDSWKKMHPLMIMMSAADFVTAVNIKDRYIYAFPLNNCHDQTKLYIQWLDLQEPTLQSLTRTDWSLLEMDNHDKALLTVLGCYQDYKLLV